MKPHQHAELIKAWADGHEIQVKCEVSNAWLDVPDPLWQPSLEYRIKPAYPDGYDKAIEDAVNYGQGFVSVQHVPLDEVIDHDNEPKNEPHWMTKELFAEYLELIYYAINDKEDRRTLFDKAYWMKRNGEV